MCYLLQESDQKLQEQLSRGLDQFTARNNCQAYFLRSLALNFAEVSIRKQNSDLLEMLH